MPQRFIIVSRLLVTEAPYILGYADTVQYVVR